MENLNLPHVEQTQTCIWITFYIIFYIGALRYMKSVQESKIEKKHEFCDLV